MDRLPNRTRNSPEWNKITEIALGHGSKADAARHLISLASRWTAPYQSEAWFSDEIRERSCEPLSAHEESP